MKELLMFIKYFFVVSMLLIPALMGMEPGKTTASQEESEREETIKKAQERYADFPYFMHNECVRATADNAQDGIELCEGIKKSLDLARQGRAKGWRFDYEATSECDSSRPEFLCSSIDKLFSREKDPYLSDDFQYFKPSEINKMLATRSAAMRKWYFNQARVAFWGTIYTMPKYFQYVMDQVTPDTYEKYERRKNS